MIDYEAHPPRRRYQESALDVRWCYRRCAYYAGLCVLLAPIAFWFVPNYIMFHRLRRPIPADYVGLAHRYRPLIASVKAYHRDVGLPATAVPIRELLPNAENADRAMWDPRFGIEIIAVDFGMLRYDLTPATEGWYVNTMFVSGRIPAPVVTAAPTTRPATTVP
jgi:hypothetical protein